MNDTETDFDASSQVFPTTDAVAVHTFGGLRVVVSE